MTIITPVEIEKMIKINKYHTSVLQIDDFKIYSDGKKYNDRTQEIKEVISKHDLSWLDCKIYVMPHSLLQVDKKEMIIGGAYQGRVIKDNVFISATCKDIEDTLIHELGHVIGYKYFHPNLFSANAHYTDDYKLFKKLVNLNNDKGLWHNRPCESLAEHFKYIYIKKTDFNIVDEAIELIKKYIPKKEVKELNKPKKIIIHHTATSKQSYDSIKKYHVIEKGFDDFAYHWYLRKDGSLRAGRKENVVGAHTKGQNDKSIGICIEGNYDKEKLSDEIIMKLCDLIKEICDRHGELEICYHNEFAKKTCPGKNFIKKDDLITLLLTPELDWKEEAFKYLNDNDIPVHEKRFNAPITRGECMALIARLHKALK